MRRIYEGDNLGFRVLCIIVAAIAVWMLVRSENKRPSISPLVVSTAAELNREIQTNQPLFVVLCTEEGQCQQYEHLLAEVPSSRQIKYVLAVGTGGAFDELRSGWEQIDRTACQTMDKIRGTASECPLAYPLFLLVQGDGRNPRDISNELYRGPVGAKKLFALIKEARETVRLNRKFH